MRRPACEIPSQRLRYAERHFTRLHEGFAPASITCADYTEPVRPYQVLGRITEIQYLKRTPKGLERYWHPFAPYAQPKVGLDARKRPIIWAGRYSVRTGGITDHARENVVPEFLPRKPSLLSDLGTLEYIRYDSLYGGSRPKTLRFSARDVLVHDEQGNLYIVRPTTEVEMRRHSSRRHHKGKKNPVEIKSAHGGHKPEFMDLAKAGAAIGLTTVAWGEISSRITPGSLTGYTRALVQGVGGMFVAKLAADFTPKMPEIPLGIASTAAVQAIVGVVNTYRAQRLITNPSGAAALGPGGMPAGYAPVNRGACAVPQYR